MSNLCILGCDPGKTGALAFLFSDSPSMVSVKDMPIADDKVCGAQLADTIRVMNPDMAIVELVGAMPGQGVSSMFNFGVSFGVIKGVVQALGIPLHLVRPNKWKKHFTLSSDKEKSRALALRLWPSRAELFARKKDENRAEAALLARYGLETILRREA
jgi:crossover junction endodeoxyribonuclease RuvC